MLLIQQKSSKIDTYFEFRFWVSFMRLETRKKIGNFEFEATRDTELFAFRRPGYMFTTDIDDEDFLLMLEKIKINRKKR